MNIKQYSKLFLVAGLLLGSQSCKDLLDETPISQVSDQYFNTRTGFEDASKAAYASFREYYGRESAMTLTVFGTDTYTMGADGSYKFVNQYTSQLDGRVDILRNTWNALYKAINLANAIVDRADKIADIDETIKKRRVAEAKFIRAHHYFLLIQIWGPVHLTLNENTVATKVASRTPVPEIYAAITADLEAALPDLPATVPTNEYGRATQGACEHLLARVYLTKATSEAAAADDYAKAETHAQNVISKYNYKLLPDFAKVFEQGAGEVNDEVIFATQYTSDPLTNIGPSFTNNGVETGTLVNGNQTHLYFGMEYDTQAGMQRDVANGRPFKRFRPTEYTLNTVFALNNRVNDSRYSKTFKDVFYSNRPGKYTNLFDTSKKEVTFNAGDTAIYIPGYEMSEAERAKKPYQVLVPSLYRANLFPALKKYFDPLRPDRTYEAGSRDFIVFRLAETYLILAEARLKQNKTAEAVQAINMVRRRAAFPGKESAMEITPDQMTMEFIMEEREREMLAEMHRWFDLKRWGVLIERVKLHNPDAKDNIIANKHELRPIPQDQIDRTAGGVEAFPQNPGY
jgi:hypothetical protein